jgi:hypothetical protein
MYKVSLDVHGVIDATPEFFSFLSKAVLTAGGEVHILTGGSWTKELEDELRELGIVWTHNFSVYDHLIENNTPTCGSVTFPDGTTQLKFIDGPWDRSKAEYCEKHGIDLHLDDTLVYNDHFTTPFARVWTHNNKPKKPHKSNRQLD